MAESSSFSEEAEQLRFPSFLAVEDEWLNDASQAATSQVLRIKSLAFVIFNVTNDSVLCL